MTDDQGGCSGSRTQQEAVTDAPKPVTTDSADRTPPARSGAPPLSDAVFRFEVMVLADA